MRLDVAIVERGLAESRERARALIMAGDVLVNSQRAIRSAALVGTEDEIAIRQVMPYVSRGGLKLEAALNAFDVPVAGAIIADIGASTGGFTDCLLQRDARRVYAVDVGYGQLHWRLRNDPRVVVVERTNVRHLLSLPEVADGATVDVSFISLALVLEPIVRLVKNDGWLIGLIKPQFEAGRAEVGKGGVVRDPRTHRKVILQIVEAARKLGWSAQGLRSSPLLGPAGNREFLVYLRPVDLGAGLTEDDLNRGIDEALAEGTMPATIESEESASPDQQDE
jgi:23S rRNA (cytidine1920-2'-O)/16S rRNA (cytidine1409-2'-O)-methyltransferase